jgi:hypothetical protein
MVVTNFGARRKSDRLVDNFWRSATVFLSRKPWQAITLYPVITENFFKAHKRLEEGKCKITDVIIGYQGD